MTRDRELRYRNDGHRVKSRLKQYRYKRKMKLRKDYRWKGTVKFLYFSVKIERKWYGLVPGMWWATDAWSPCSSSASPALLYSSCSATAGHPLGIVCCLCPIVGWFSMTQTKKPAKDLTPQTLQQSPKTAFKIRFPAIKGWGCKSTQTTCCRLLMKVQRIEFTKDN